MGSTGRVLCTDGVKELIYLLTDFFTRCSKMGEHVKIPRPSKEHQNIGRGRIRLEQRGKKGEGLRERTGHSRGVREVQSSWLSRSRSVSF